MTEQDRETIQAGINMAYCHVEEICRKALMNEYAEKFLPCRLGEDIFELARVLGRVERDVRDVATRTQRIDVLGECEGTE